VISGYFLSTFEKRHSMTVLDDKNLELQESFKELLGFLEEQGVSKDIIFKFSNEFPFCRNMAKPSELLPDLIIMKDILHTCQGYSRCYPYMNASKLIEKIHQNWDALSSCYRAGKDLVKKKLEKIKKKDPAVIENLHLLQKEYNGESIHFFSFGMFPFVSQCSH